MSKRTSKNPKNWHNTPVVLCWHKIFFLRNKRQWISFRPKRWNVPYRNHQACCEKLWSVRSIYQNLPQMGQIFYHGMLMLLHYCMPSFMNFGFTRIKKASTSTFAGEPRCRGVRISSPFLAWEISINPWTHIWFYNPCWCTEAFASSLILNCAPEMARKPS